MLVNSNEMLKLAQTNKKVVFHFNINNLEWTKYILEACENIKESVILGVSEGAIKYMGGYNVVSSLVRSLIDDLNITTNVALHLDHGSSVESCIKAIDAGFTSVMIDASKYDLETNIKMTNEVVSYAHPKGVSVEGEVGHIGGTEDNTSSEIAYAKVEDVITYIKATNVDSIAPALGSVHGIYKGIPNIDVKRMNEISFQINTPLVLHGGSGLSDEIIKDCIKNGITKININTQLQIVWAKAVLEFVNAHPDVYDPRKVISSGREAIMNTIYEMVNKYKGEVNE